MKDAELVRRFRAGDQAAWEALDRRYRGPLERFARRMLHDVAPGQVEDVVQEALWRAHRALMRDTRVLELRPWLYRLTRNCCLDERARVRTDAVELERAAGVADRADGPAATVERRGALRTLLDDVSRLPELQRHALLRRELDGLSHDELAAELGLSAGATRSLVHRARGALTRAAEGRALGCGDVRSDIFDAHDGRRRPTARTLRHLATCPTCRALQSALRSQRRSLAALAPPVGLLAALGGLGFAGWQAKATAIGTTAVVAAGVSAELFEAGDPSPLAMQSIALPGKRVAAGAPLPDGVAVVRGEVRYPDVRRVTLSCPPGLRLADLLPPEGGRVSAHYGETTTIGADHSGEIVLTGRARDVDVTVAALCRRPDAGGSLVDPSNASTRDRG
ncbi:RNA polymerase sigma factor [Solirubrobacter soli]|uniref:RNA polymerase sigma factor n=1 Tax=Solirubrobacter soli TaxID=363832 RepID=UPI00146BE11A|nr:sigma-70 family RNA polymerase sigma factor [Solirubrobacter soli]